jgi:hypothetical protein
MNKKGKEIISPEEEMGDIIRKSIPISQALAEKINKSKWTDYPTIIKKEQELAEKYNISDLGELSPFIIKGLEKENPNLENELVKNLRIELRNELPYFISRNEADTETKRIIKEFLREGNLRAPDTVEKTTALYNTLLKYAKIFRTEAGDYQTLSDFAIEEYFGKIEEMPLWEIECVVGKKFDQYSEMCGKNLGLKDENLKKFIERRKNSQAYLIKEQIPLNHQHILERNKIIFNLHTADWGLGAVTGTILHELGHLVIAKLLESYKKISPEMRSFKLTLIHEGVAEDFTQFTLKRLDEIYKNKGFDVVAIKRQVSSLVEEDISYKYGSSIVNILRENSSPEDFKTKELPKLLKVASGEMKIGEL